MAPRTLLVDGFDLGTIGAFVEQLEGWRDGAERSWATASVPGGVGETVIATRPHVTSRNVVARVVLDASDAAGVIAIRDEVVARFGKRERTVTFVDDETREFRARLLSMAVIGIRPHLTQRASEGRMNLWLPDPRILAAADTVVPFTTATQMPLGSAVSLPVIVVTGSGDFILTYTPANGDPATTFQIAGATAPVTIDMETHTISDAGGENAALFVGGPGQDFILLDPDDADYSAGFPPTFATLATSAGSATATYRKAF